MKKGYSKPLTEIELNVVLEVSVMAGSVTPTPNNFDPNGLDNASLVGNSPRMNFQNQAANLWDDEE